MRYYLCITFFLPVSILLVDSNFANSLLSILLPNVKWAGISVFNHFIHKSFVFPLDSERWRWNTVIVIFSLSGAKIIFSAAYGGGFGRTVGEDQGPASIAHRIRVSLFARSFYELLNQAEISLRWWSLTVKQSSPWYFWKYPTSMTLAFFKHLIWFLSLRPESNSPPQNSL